MIEPRTSRREFWFVVAAGSGLMLLTGAGAYWIKENADRRPLTLELAIDENSQFLPATHGLAANNAVGDLLESLPPDLALDVCASLTGGPARTAKRPCDELREVTALAPAAPPTPFGSAMASVPAAVLTAPPVPADVVSAPAAAAPPQPAPNQAAIARREPIPDAPVTQTAAAVGPPAALLPSGFVVAGAPIASAQTTERPAAAAARDQSGVHVSVLEEGTEPAPPTMTAPEYTMAYWLFLSGMPEGDSSNGDGPSEEAAAEDDADLADAAAAAKAQADAKAAAAAQAKAKARANAAARGKALAAALNADNDSGNGANPGKGKDRDQGSAGAGSSSGGGGNNN